MNSLKHSTKNLRFVIAESAITAGLLSIPVMTPFFNSIGLSQAEIAETQMIFTIIVMFLNVPTGYLADRISRKWANIIGDFAFAITLLAYAKVSTFWGAVTCECILGIASAITAGVDQSLLQHFTNEIAKATGDNPDTLLKSKTASLEIMRQLANFVLLLLGGPIGAISLRLAIALSGINYFVGGIVGCFIDDTSEKFHSTHQSPLRDMTNIVRSSLQNSQLRTRIFAYSVSRQMTHGIIWVATPLFLKAGVPLVIVSFAWAFNSAMAILGARLAMRFSKGLSDTKILAVPTILMTVSMLIIGLHLNLVTVWLYGFSGITQGWTAATMSPMVQKHTHPSEQTSVLSLTKTISELLYIPTVWLIGLAADIKIEYAPLATVAIFIPLSLLVMRSLSKSNTTI